MSTRSLSALVSASCLFLLDRLRQERRSAATDSGRRRARRHPSYDTDAEKIVNVYNWSDYIEPTVLDEFTKETGITGQLRGHGLQRAA